MNTLHRLLLGSLAALSLLVPGCDSESDQPLAIPDGVYQDAGGLVKLSLQGQGRKAVLDTTLLGGPVHVEGLFALIDGDFYIINVADTLSFRLFGRRTWTWETDHFVVEEHEPPGRTLELRRK